jgi:hypothetical protein
MKWTNIFKGTGVSSLPPAAPLPAGAVPVSAMTGFERTAGVMLQGLGIVGCLTGALAVAVGGVALSDAIKNNDVAGKWTSSLDIVGGTALAASGAISLASALLVPVGALGPLAVPLMIVGCTLGFVSMGIKGIVDNVKHDRAVKCGIEDQRTDFYDWAQDGLAEKDWEDKVDYLQAAYGKYGNDNVNKDTQSYLEYQAKEFEYFKNKEIKRGSDEQRLSKDEHIHTKENEKKVAFIAQNQPRGESSSHDDEGEDSHWEQY